MFVPDANEDYHHSVKQDLFTSGGFEEIDDLEEDLLPSQKDHASEDLFLEIPHSPESDSSSRTDPDDWGLLNCRILGKVFHFKSFAISAATRRFWISAVKAFWSVSKHVDFSFIGPTSDAIYNIILLGGFFDYLYLTYVLKA